MNKGRSLELYFVDGRPDGMLTAEVVNWTGHVLRIPKIRLPDGLRRPEAKQTGVYVLLGQDETGSLAYIGEAENMADRLRQHASQKEWWDEAVLVTTAGDGLHKAHVKYLESRLVEIAKDAGVMRLENGNIPPKASLNEAATANMESFLDTLHMVLPAIRVDMFQGQKQVIEAKPTSRVDQSQSIEFRFIVPKHGYDAKIRYENEELVLLSGAIMCPEAQIREHLPRVLELRNSLRTNGDLQVEQQYEILKTNLVFKSPSAVADFVSGRSTNGRTSLKLPSGKTYAEWEEEQLEKVDE
ncbi:GIY-YIG nuclease family protein [uncultured Pelagimonas sp.]|uniref:GIY-YIG nuclease family protein n=1 Tax=uncultured Pelagimonas sp. TaxID=1618102 RepID=UPI0026252671|nr:GIY-YIG nuclease family protein [uncultured Pelagimonas sp.]